MKSQPDNGHRSRGLSLVELLVAITLGAILLGGAVTLFVNNRDAYNTTNDMARLQETARFAVEVMLKDIRMAGYFGCADRLDTVRGNADDTDPATNDPQALWDPTHPIEGMDGDDAASGFYPSGAAAPGTALVAAPYASDAITLRYMAGSMTDAVGAVGTPDFQVTADVANGDAVDITVDAPNAWPTFVRSQVAVIADCGSSEVFHVTNDPAGGSILTANHLERTFNQIASPTVGPYVAVRYFVADNGRGPGGEIYPSLFRTVLDIDPPAAVPTSPPVESQPQELFEGVETLQLLYGVDTDADGAPDSYVQAGVAPLDVAANWQNIVSVRIGMVVRTVDQYGQNVDTNTYVVNDVAAFNPVDDRRRRRVFSTTAAVRNL